MRKSVIEHGRSIVEILGVLAVIGVLSFIGLAGYNFAMKKHIQNELKNELAMRAIAVSSQMLAGQNPNLGSFATEVGGYKMSLSAAPSASAFGDSGYVDENGNPLNFTEVIDPNSEDKEFAIGVDGLPADLVEWFLQLAQQAGMIQRIVDSTGTTLTPGQDWQHAAVYGGTGSTTGNTTNNTYNIYIIFASDLAQKKSDNLEEFVGSQCNDHGTYTYLPIYGAGCQCELGYSGEKCSEKSEACNGQGVWYDGTLGKICLCNPGKTGVRCEQEAGNSPCQDAGASEGKACEQAGIAGKCNSGSCIASSKYYKCSTIDQECGEGYFCHYGDTTSDIKTPNICEKVNADEFQVKGESYYVNTDKDLRSWCRAKSGKDCDWGFLAYEGAQSWCAGLEEEAHLLTKDELCSIKDRLPKVLANQKYWASEGKIVEITPSGCQEVSDKTAAAGVVCKKGSAIASVLTAEEQKLLDEIKQITGKAADINTLKEKLAKVTQTRQKFEPAKDEEDKKRVDAFKETESQLTALITIMEKWHQDALEIVDLSDNLTAENVEKLHSLLQEYEANNYSQKVLKILGLGGSLTTAQDTYSKKASEIIHGLFGIKTAYAGGSAGGGLAGMCAEYATGAVVWDLGVWGAGTLGDLTCWLCDIETRPSDYAKYLNVAVLVDTVVDSVPYLDKANHCHQILLKELADMITEYLDKNTKSCSVCPEGEQTVTDAVGRKFCCPKNKPYVVYDTETGEQGCCETEGAIYSGGKCSGCPEGEQTVTDAVGRKFCCPKNKPYVVYDTETGEQGCCETEDAIYSGGKCSGCPDGGELKGEHCCKDGLAYVPDAGYVGEEEVCRTCSVTCDTETGVCRRN